MAFTLACTHLHIEKLKNQEMTNNIINRKNIEY